MLSNINPTSTGAWNRLQNHYETKAKKFQLKELFKSNPKRFDEFSIWFDDILIDYSKNMITSETFGMLLELAEEMNLKQAVDDFFNGEKINRTENRSVLHTALRNFSSRKIHVDGEDVMPLVKSVLGKMKSFSDDIISGKWKGYTGKPIRKHT